VSRHRRRRSVRPTGCCCSRRPFVLFYRVYDVYCTHTGGIIFARCSLYKPVTRDYIIIYLAVSRVNFSIIYWEIFFLSLFIPPPARYIGMFYFSHFTVIYILVFTNKRPRNLRERRRLESGNRLHNTFRHIVYYFTPSYNILLPVTR